MASALPLKTIHIMDADALKKKVSDEFKDLLCELRKGYLPDYEFLMEEISLIDTYNNLDNSSFIIQYYLNNKWQK